jgi:hypothetical protein
MSMLIARSGWWKWQALGAALLAAASLAVGAGQKSASFIVAVDMLAEEKNTGQCNSVTQPGKTSVVVLSCGTPHATPTRSENRFLLNLYRTGEFLGTVDGMMSTGTVTSWRVIHVMNRDYLEIMVGW